MRYLGLMAAIVVLACVFAYVMNLPSKTSRDGDSNSYGNTINSVRSTIKAASGAEQRRKWAIAQQMKTYGSTETFRFSTGGENAETIVVASENMDSLMCSRLASGEIGTNAAEVGFRSISCRTTADGIVVEKELP